MRSLDAVLQLQLHLQGNMARDRDMVVDGLPAFQLQSALLFLHQRFPVLLASSKRSCRLPASCIHRTSLRCIAMLTRVQVDHTSSKSERVYVLQTDPM